MLTSPGLKAFLTADILVVNRPTGAGPAAYLGKLVAWLSESRWQCLSRPNVQAIIIVVAAFQNNKNTAHNATACPSHQRPAVFSLKWKVINISDKIFLMENSDFANVAAGRLRMVQWEIDWPHVFT